MLRSKVGLLDARLSPLTPYQHTLCSLFC